jgi:hypothetical protein
MSNWLWLLFAVGTVLCWGSYGPTLHEGTKALQNPWKAILCVGGAYFVLGVIIPLVILQVQGASMEFPSRGLFFGGVAGALGALGAIFIVGALKSGGLPLYVMPLVFGGAPLVNVIVSSLMHPPKEAPSPLLYVGFLVAAAGAGMVLYFKPS